MEAAVAVARERRGTQFDPALVDVFCAEAPALFEDIDSATTWHAVIEAEPALEIVLSDAELESALEAIADFTDLKSPWTIGHSRGVADLAHAAAALYGLSAGDATLVRRAGLVHDLGRLGVSNAIWDKPGALTPAERERVRLHPYLTERMLASSGALAPLGAIAVQHHERLDGSGYPRGLSGDALTPAGRVLAAADAYRAMTEPRPHRAALSPRGGGGGAALRRPARRSSTATPSRPCCAPRAIAIKRRREWPAGLTSREIEVLQAARARAVEQGDRRAARDLAQDGGQPRRAHLREDRRLQSRAGQPVRDEARPDGRRPTRKIGRTPDERGPRRP